MAIFSEEKKEKYNTEEEGYRVRERFDQVCLTKYVHAENMKKSMEVYLHV